MFLLRAYLLVLTLLLVANGSPIDITTEFGEETHDENASLNSTLKAPRSSLFGRSADTDARCSSFNTASARYTAQQAWCRPTEGRRNFNVVCLDQYGQTSPRTGTCAQGYTCYQIPDRGSLPRDIACIPDAEVEKGIGYSNDYALIVSPDSHYSIGKVARKMNFDCHTFDINGNLIQVRKITQWINGDYAGSASQANTFDNDWYIKNGDEIHFSADRGTGAFVVLQWTAKFVG